MAAFDTFRIVAAVVMGQFEPVSAANHVAKNIQPLEDSIYTLWRDIIGLSQGGDMGQESLVTFTVTLSDLPDVHDEQGVVKHHGGVLWRDLPMFGWEINSLWNKNKNHDNFVDAARFVAMLIDTDRPVFQPFRLQILWTFRTLEDKYAEFETAIAAIVSVLGNKIATWGDEYESSPISAPGRGGPLWKGKHGFSSERYELWKKRLIELGTTNNLAAETVQKMIN